MGLTANVLPAQTREASRIGMGKYRQGQKINAAGHYGQFDRAIQGFSYKIPDKFPFSHLDDRQIEGTFRLPRGL
jgi:hypothetical protein